MLIDRPASDPRSFVMGLSKRRDRVTLRVSYTMHNGSQAEFSVLTPGAQVLTRGGVS